MILQALARYYDILAEDADSGVAPTNYSKANVSMVANISPSGELLELIPMKRTVRRGKKDIEISVSDIVPEQVKRASGVSPNFLCDNSSYVFGIDNKGKANRSKECFLAFKELHELVLGNVDCMEVKALLAYLDNWEIDKAVENKILSADFEELFRANIVFKLDGGDFLHRNKQIKTAWERYNNAGCDNETIMQCLVTGDKSPIERLHPIIKGVKGAQSAGASLISFNAGAYESYGKSGKNEGQGANSPVSKDATFAYGTALNYLLTDNNHRLTLGDATIVYWAESSTSTYSDVADLLFQPDELENNEKYSQDNSAINLVRDVFEKIATGRYINYTNLEFGLDTNVNFYILALSPNAARLSVRFFLKDSFGQFVEKIAKHYEDMQIEKERDTDKSYISLWSILNQTVSPKSTDKSASPLLAGSVLKSIISGVPYPVALLNYIMLRIKAEQSINYEKVAIIKAYLKRKNKFKGELTMSLNVESKEPAYLCGRLFAVLEKLQYDANGGNSNIREKYFSSASANPKIIFPTLLKLAQHHIAKADSGAYYDKLISEIVENVNAMPGSLQLEEQGVFVLGYYHQKNDLWRKKEDRISK